MVSGHVYLRFLLSLCVGFLSGCSEKITGDERFGSEPETELTWGPADSDTTTFRVHFFWSGSDKDGEVVRYRLAVDADTTRPPSTWTPTTATDSILEFPVDPVTAIRKHAFSIASEDNDGWIDPTPARRFFTTRTIPPTSCITRGPIAYNPIVPQTFTFEWGGEDPDGGVLGQGDETDSFEYLLLRTGARADSSDLSHEPLPQYQQSWYVEILNQAKGETLPEPYADWRWTGLRETSRRFMNIAPGTYVFAVRAVDEAGAREETLEFGCNIRALTVVSSTYQVSPQLSVCTDALLGCLHSTGPDYYDWEPVEVLEGESVSFSWTASASSYGGVIAGYSYALDDTASMPPLDPARTAVTLTTNQLPAGSHFLFIRAADTEGYVTNVLVRIQVIHAGFRDPTQGRSVLYVDDSTAPGVFSPWQDQVTSFGNWPNDVTETEWWTQGLLNQLGVPVTEWDATLAGAADLQARKPPPLRTLANYSTVIWNADFNNSVSFPNAIWTTLVGGREAALRSYVRGGGTLILTGFDMSSNVVNPTTTFDALSSSLCSAFEVGSPSYRFTYVPRTMMGMDGAIVSKSALRRDGARDFVATYPTAQGSALGFDSALVDTGPPGSAAKWVTEDVGPPEQTLSPGLPRVDGWVMASTFNCASGLYRVEDPGQGIAEPILLYHGVNRGVNRDLGPSPREGLVAGIRVQAHDLGETAGVTPIVTPGDARGVYGRAVFLSFPLYFLEDDQASRLMQTAFQYVNASPTLP